MRSSKKSKESTKDESSPPSLEILLISPGIEKLREACIGDRASSFEVIRCSGFRCASQGSYVGVFNLRKALTRLCALQHCS